MRILAFEVEQDTAEPRQFAPLLESEAIQVWNLWKAQVIREIHFRADRRTAVLTLEVNDLDEARAHLATLPLVQAGLIKFDLVPLAPYTGFERLFDVPDAK